MNTICLDKTYSTTKLVIQEKLEIVNNPENKFKTVLFLVEDEGRKGEGGLRTKGYFKKSFEDKHLISIITVVYNGEKYLEETIRSVINQTYDNVEYIIIDGGSSDGTLDIIKKYEDQIDYWISEKDKGIYDAMNKGVDVVSGEWINFMNAGDMFYDDKVLINISKFHIDENIQCIYGDVSTNYGNFEVIKKAGNISELNKGMQFSHQSLFVKSDYHKANKFDLSYKSAGDFNFIFNSYMDNVQFFYARLIFSKVSNGGVSDIKRINSLKEAKKIVLSRSDTLLNRFYFYRLFTKIFMIDTIKKILPLAFVQYLQSRR